jgi:hypothetical protein
MSNATPEVVSPSKSLFPGRSPKINDALDMTERRTTPIGLRTRPKPDHLFVNNVRFWSMVSIIGVHSAGEFESFKASHSSHLGIAIIAALKFGTIGFFLVSGFLLGERVDRRNPIEYFMRRLKKVFLPWLFWFGILCALLMTHELIDHSLGHSSLVPTLRLAFTTARSSLIASPFWFVPNLLLCIAVLLAFRRHLYSLKLGAILFAVNLVYVVNIYTLWFQPQHTKAIFAFVFYLWLGSYAAENFSRISKVLARIPTAIFVTLALITGVAAYFESCLLALRHNPDPFNTLRLTNQAFSICMVLVFFKLTRATWPRIVDVRRHTFGIYLTHFIALIVLVRVLKSFRHFIGAPVNVSNMERVFMWTTLSLLTYLCCLIIASLLAARPSLQWLVGLGTADDPKVKTSHKPLDVPSFALLRSMETVE